MSETKLKRHGESHADQIARVCLMATGDSQWDLSDNDVVAIKTVLEERNTLRDVLLCVQEWLMFSRPLDRPDLWHPLFVKANDLTAQALAKVEGRS